jgi:hypothetical protein
MNYHQVLGREEQFDPEHRLFDFMLYRVTKEALSKGFKMPFRLQFVEASQSFIKEAVVVQGADGAVFEEHSGSRGRYQLPFACNLSDVDGQKCACILSVDVMRQLMGTGSGPIAFPVDPTDLF